MLNLRSSPRREPHIHSTRLEPASLLTWKQWRVTTRKTLHEWVPRWFHYIAPWKYIYIHIQSYSKVKKFVVITSVSANKAGKTIQTTLGPSPFHHLRASATPSKLADDGVGTGEAAFGDADEFFMRINPLLYRMFIYKDLHTYKGIHTYKYINRHYTQQRRRFHSPGRRRGLQICSYANISWIYIYIYIYM